jgi:2-polyprenyl-6-hydroxyphenyl methylase/3-demethylubiquinone-9 3-methyltransferase
MTQDTSQAPQDASGATLDAAEIAKFSALAAEWWNPTGKMAVLHRFNPVRLGYIRDEVVRHFSRDERSLTPLKGLRLLDIGCGGGLISEPLSRMGAEVVGVDPSRTNIETCKIHSAQSGANVDFRCASAEDLHAAGETFDIVLAMEVVEHVADVNLFLSTCASMVRPGGLMFAATLNRTLKAYGLAIVGAEYVLGWLPRGTHDWKKFVTPQELEAGLRIGGVEPYRTDGVTYNPLFDRWSLARDTDVNYMMVARKAS